MGPGHVLALAEKDGPTRGMELLFGRQVSRASMLRPACAVRLTVLLSQPATAPRLEIAHHLLGPGGGCHDEVNVIAAHVYGP
jgi:hypothetical protein